MKKQIKKTDTKHRVLRSIYPNEFQDAILLELIETQKALKVKRIFEKDVLLTDIELIHIANISESRFLKYKMNFLAKLLTV